MHRKLVPFINFENPVHNSTKLKVHFYQPKRPRIKKVVLRNVSKIEFYIVKGQSQKSLWTSDFLQEHDPPYSAHSLLGGTSLLTMFFKNSRRNWASTKILTWIFQVLNWLVWQSSPSICQSRTSSWLISTMLPPLNWTRLTF